MALLSVLISLLIVSFVTVIDNSSLSPFPSQLSICALRATLGLSLEWWGDHRLLFFIVISLHSSDTSSDELLPFLSDLL